MTVEQFAYLKCPSKIRAAIINEGGPRLSVDAVKRRLSIMPSKVEGAHIGEPTEADGQDFRVATFVKPAVIPKRQTVQQLSQDRNRIAALAALIPDRKVPKPRKHQREKQPIPKAATDLIDQVCNELGLTHVEFFSPRTQLLPFAARSLVAVILRERNPNVYSYPRIADVLGRKDHSTIIHLVRKFDVCCRQYPEVAALYLKLQGGGE